MRLFLALLMFCSLAHAQAPVLIEFYGDSLEYSYAGAGPSGNLTRSVNAEPEAVQSILQKSIGLNVSTSNQGVCGTTAWQLYSGTDGVHPPWSQQMAQSKASIVVIEFGINDDAQGYLPANYDGVINVMVAEAKQAGKIVVLEEPNPVVTQLPLPLSDYVSVLDWSASYNDVAIIPQYEWIAALQNWQAMLFDGVHPDDALYLLKAQHAAQVLQGIIK